MKGLKVDFRLKSNIHRCSNPNCGKYLKINLVNKKLNPPLRCYSCHVQHENARGHIMKRDVK